MEGLWRAATGQDPSPEDYTGIEFWSNPERATWLTKQGEYIKTWRRRWFVLKQGKLFWFKDSYVTRSSTPRGVIPVGTCMTVKGAEDVVSSPPLIKIRCTSSPIRRRRRRSGSTRSDGPSSGTPDRSQIPRSSITIVADSDHKLSIFMQTITNRPLAGTVRRGETPKEDLLLEKQF